MKNPSHCWSLLLFICIIYKYHYISLLSIPGMESSRRLPLRILIFIWKWMIIGVSLHLISLFGCASNIQWAESLQGRLIAHIHSRTLRCIAICRELWERYLSFRKNKLKVQKQQDQTGIKTPCLQEWKWRRIKIKK